MQKRLLVVAAPIEESKGHIDEHVAAFSAM